MKYYYGIFASVSDLRVLNINQKEKWGFMEIFLVNQTVLILWIVRPMNHAIIFKLSIKQWNSLKIPKQQKQQPTELW